MAENPSSLPDDLPPDDSLMEIKQFPNAFRIPGILHVMDNCLGHILTSCQIWPSLLKGLRLLEVLLARPLYRERFVHACLETGKCDELKSWSYTLRGLRWQSVMEFTIALKGIESTIRQLDHSIWHRCADEVISLPCVPLPS